MTEGKRMLQMMKQNNKLTKKLVLSLVSLAVMTGTHAANEQFNDALRAANSGDVDLLQQYQHAMQNDVLGICGMRTRHHGKRNQT